MLETKNAKPNDETSKHDLARARLELLSNTAMLKRTVEAKIPSILDTASGKQLAPETTPIQHEAPLSLVPMPVSPPPRLPNCAPLHFMMAIDARASCGLVETLADNATSMPVPDIKVETTNHSATNSAGTNMNVIRSPVTLPPVSLPSSPSSTPGIVRAPMMCPAPMYCGAEVIPSSSSSSPAAPSYQSVMDENLRLKSDLGEAKREIAKLRLELGQAKKGMMELRSLPTGKISQIPISDMLELMEEYGSETSDHHYQAIKRNKPPQPASIVRQFRRWNPEFLKYFIFKNGKWEPKLGKEGELQRRQIKRLALKEYRRNPPKLPPL
mmetsp:Transcript_22642/g.52261  ORF Transcript_22642/g.52261 Transcript_22642/m.52261 type:complete len:326 (-) Transcript_22642:1011-1988(-)